MPYLSMFEKLSKKYFCKKNYKRFCLVFKFSLKTDKRKEEAALEYPRDAALVQFVVDDGVGACSAFDLSSGELILR